MRAAAYLRVSSEKQADEDRFGYHRQIGDIAAYAARAGLELVAEYRDAITGKSVSRKGLDQLIAAADRFDAVIISSVDRLARDIGSSYQVLANLLGSGVQVHSADQGLIDLDQESSLIQFNLQALFAHLERQKIVKRTRSAVIAIAERGEVPDGLNTFGYRVEKRKAIIVPEEAAVVRDIFERSAKGETLVAIARHLTEAGVPRRKAGLTPWRFTDVRQIITRKTYRGEYHWSSYVIPVPAIVTPELWRAAQPRGRGRPWGASPLQLIGHIRCARCGRRMTSLKMSYDPRRYKRPGAYWAYACNSRSFPEWCHAPTVSGRWLDGVAEAEVRAALSDRRRVREALAAASSAVDQSSGERERLEEEDRRWLEAFRMGVITAAELGRYREDVRRRLKALGDSRPPVGRDVSAYVRAARSMPFRELLRFADVLVVAEGRTFLEVRLFEDHV